MTVDADGDRFEQLFNLVQDLLLELSREYDRAREDALRDPLTGLPNRRAFEPLLEQEVRRARRYGRHLTLVMIDIDHFKTFNDLHGHRFGDELLKQISRIFQRELREPDMVFRVGGEEFVIMLPETTAQGAATMIRRLRERIRRDERVTVTLSFGIAEFPTHADDAEPLIVAADQALYQAKEAGRDTIRLPDGSSPADPAAAADRPHHPGTRTDTNGVRDAGAGQAPVVRRVEVGFHVDDDRPASIWLDGRLVRVHEAVPSRSGAGPDPSAPVFHVRTDDGDYRLRFDDGLWYLEGTG